MTARQYENRIKIIVVAAVAKQFRRSRIIDRVIATAQSDGAVASGRLINPESSGSIIPFRDDQWLNRKGAVDVSVGEIKNNSPSKINVRVNIEYGLDEKYDTLREDRERARVYPNITAIKNWIRDKSRRGISFTYRNGELDISNDKHLTSVAFAVSKGIKKDGIKNKSKLFNPFTEGSDNVYNTVVRGMANSEARIIELYDPILLSAVEDILEF